MSTTQPNCEDCVKRFLAPFLVYQPQVDRWLQPDPAQQGSNWYEGIGDAPTDGRDPSGNYLLASSATEAQRITAYYADNGIRLYSSALPAWGTARYFLWADPIEQQKVAQFRSRSDHPWVQRTTQGLLSGYAVEATYDNSWYTSFSVFAKEQSTVQQKVKVWTDKFIEEYSIRTINALRDFGLSKDDWDALSQQDQVALILSVHGNDQRWLSGVTSRLARLSQKMVGTLGLGDATLENAISGASYQELVGLRNQQRTYQAMRDEDAALRGLVAEDPAAQQAIEQQTQEFITEERRKFEAALPGKQLTNKEKLAPWLYGNYDYFKPTLSVTDSGLAVSFIPTQKCVALQAAQMIQATWVVPNEKDGPADRTASVSFKANPQGAIAQFLLLGTTPPDRLVQKGMNVSKGAQFDSTPLELAAGFGFGTMAARAAGAGLGGALWKGVKAAAGNMGWSLAAQAIDHVGGEGTTLKAIAGIAAILAGKKVITSPVVKTALVKVLNAEVRGVSLSKGMRAIVAKVRKAFPKRDPAGAINLIDRTREAENNNFFRNILRRNDKDPDGFLDVVAHGNDKKLLVFNDLEDADYVAHILLSDDAFKGQVRLLSCFSGYGNDSFAQQLANKLKELKPNLTIEVKANNGFLHAADDGSYYLRAGRKVGDTFVVDPKGRAGWFLFTPDKPPVPCKP